MKKTTRKFCNLSSVSLILSNSKSCLDLSILYNVAGSSAQRLAMTTTTTPTACTVSDSEEDDMDDEDYKEIL
jgi:metal-sulfur cluster biosynthetic enzyme